MDTRFKGPETSVPTFNLSLRLLAARAKERMANRVWPFTSRSGRSLEAEETLPKGDWGINTQVDFSNLQVRGSSSLGPER